MNNEKKINVGLVQINNNYSGQSYLPYSIGLLEAYVKANSKNPELYNFLLPVHLRIPPDNAVNMLQFGDIIGFSVYVWNINISLEIARRLKERSPNVLIVFGGPQVPNHAEEFLRMHKYIDLAVHGEGEIAFLQILENYTSKDWSKVFSSSYINNDQKYIMNPNSPRMENLGKELSPYLNDTFLPLMNANPDEHWLAIWETNRGCPYSCSYCDWGSATQSKVKKFDLERVIDEVDWFAKNKIEFVFCADANFGMLERDFEIASKVAESKKNFGYPRTISVQNAKNATEKAYKVQKLLADSKLNTAITISFQSTDEKTLENIKRSNIKLDSFRELQRRFTRDKIPTYTDIIIGLPGETYDSYANGVASVIEGGQHNRIFFMNLSILPNAEMGNPEYQKKFGMEIVENGVVYIRGSINQANDEFAETQQLVIANNTLSREDWVRARTFAWLCNFLHFNKVLQIPLLVLNKHYNCGFRELIELFCEGDHSGYPMIQEVKSFFIEKAKAIQNGDHEFCPAPQWLSVYWPVDEFLFIKFSTESKFNEFYDEAENRIIKYLVENNKNPSKDLIHEAVTLNKVLLKQPFQTNDIYFNSNYNLWDFYTSILNGEDSEILSENQTYLIDKTSKSWDSWEKWCREVVWYCSKSGAYLYNVSEREKFESTEFKLAGHH